MLQMLQMLQTSVFFILNKAHKEQIAKEYNAELYRP